MTGAFRYDVAGQIDEVNVLDVAARSGQLASIDPTIGPLLTTSAVRRRPPDRS